MFIKVEPSGTSLVVSGLSVSTREGEGSIPGHGVEISQATAKKNIKSSAWNHTVFVLCLAYFTEYNVLKVHPYCIRISFLRSPPIPLYAQTTGHLACFHILAIVNKASLTTGIQIPL